jgi:ubiquitin-protein ligase
MEDKDQHQSSRSQSIPTSGREQEPEALASTCVVVQKKSESDWEITNENSLRGSDQLPNMDSMHDDSLMCDEKIEEQDDSASDDDENAYSYSEYTDAYMSFSSEGEEDADSCLTFLPSSSSGAREDDRKLAKIRRQLVKRDGRILPTTESEDYNSDVDVSVRETPSRIFAQGRILKDIHEIEYLCPPGITAAPTDDDIFLWTTTIAAPNDSPYQGGVFEGIIQFTSEYPYIPPTLTFFSSIFHPNISESGLVCLDGLHRCWNPSYTLWSFLMAAQYLLADPSYKDAANIPAADVFLHQHSMYVKIAQDCVQQQKRMKTSESSPQQDQDHGQMMEETDPFPTDPSFLDIFK